LAGWAAGIYRWIDRHLTPGITCPRHDLSSPQLYWRASQLTRSLEPSWCTQPLTLAEQSHMDLF
jgi:hypothetical protein